MVPGKCSGGPAKIVNTLEPTRDLVPTDWHWQPVAQVGYGVVVARHQDRQGRPVATSGVHERIARLLGRHNARPPMGSWWSISACRLSQEHIGKS
jgi:hypothetical protein